MMNSGLVQLEPRANASDSVLRLIKRMYRPGSHPLPVMGYRAEVVQVISGCFCLLMHERTDLPLMTVAVAEDRRAADRMWPGLVRYCDALRGCPAFASLARVRLLRPPIVPWYATLAMLSDRDEAVFLTDFCRHYAWGWIEHQQTASAWRHRVRLDPPHPQA